MSKFSSFIELLVKQTCRRASHEFEMGSKHSSAPLPVIPEHDATGIYSLEFLKSLHDRPRENIYKLLKSPDDLNNVKVPNGLNWLNSSEFSNVERKTLLDFLKKVKDMSPSKSQKWIDLHHYMHYVYRNFANPNPDPSAEVLSPFFIAEMRELVKSLLEEDESQLYLRVLALLREYCIFAQWNYSKSDGDHCITRLFYYYEAMLSAAKNVSAVFTEFEVIIYKNYSVCWIDFNTCVFIRYFFETEFVQTKIYQCLETKVSPGDTPAMFGLLEDLKNLWIREQKRTHKINDDHSLVEGTISYYIEEAMIGNHKRVLTSNFWVERTQQEKNDLDLRRLDHHFFRLLCDPFFHPAGPILDRNGQCICEECLIAKYECILDVEKDQLNDRFLRNVNRLTYCRRCSCLVDLEVFHRHINGHAVTVVDTKNTDKSTNISKIEPEKIQFVQMENGNENCPDLVSTEENENDAEIAKEQPTSNEKTPNPKIASEAPFFKNTCDIHFSKPQHDPSELNCTKLVFEEFLKHKKESVKKEQLLNKNMRNFIKIKKDIFNHNNTTTVNSGFDSVLKPPQNTVTKKCDTSKPKEEQKNGHKCENLEVANVLASRSEGVSRLVEELERKNENGEEEATNLSQGHLGCEHGECNYCDVYEMSQFHKNKELRDKLRIRLHQRREKRSKDACRNPAPGTSNINNSKVKTVVNKVEERVPLPSSPTNIPPAPCVKSSESSITTSSATDDISGLVNYIEGNTALNKMELAQKKAAKKARQRMKKEEERRKCEEELKRLAEEQKKKEAEKRKELVRKLVEKEKAKAAEAAAAAKALKDQKKKSKKERQAEKKRLAQRGSLLSKITKKPAKEEVNIVEETIPAMVTIKRVAESVTITLKGSTPDQDKLLYKMVNGSDDTSLVKQEVVEDQSNGSNSAKKKKKQKQQNKIIPPTVVTKELKVTVAFDNSNPPQESKKVNKSPIKTTTEIIKPPIKPKETKKTNGQELLPNSLFRLPPGITITKVKGPVANRNFPLGKVDEQKSTTLNVEKSGVIVVDTEKLIHNQKTVEDSSHSNTGKNGKKNKKKKSKKLADAQPMVPPPQASKKMVTLKNPLYDSIPKRESSRIDRNSDICEPAAIFKNENGTVTIRSSKLHESLSNGAALNPMPMAMPGLLSKPTPSPTPYIPPPVEETTEITPFNAQAILSGLPGIEITKVIKKVPTTEPEVNKSCQTAQVSIMPSQNCGEKFNFEKDDWMYDSVFSPRDILEDDMDAEERELEAFKRFCQQSVPPERKEKVAHLNVADIVFKKKTDINFL